ncbi:hypothetical protein EIN_318350 [Entamoeba invadens IP1]|uniref:Uncharacterized protein n=1 Tax=Entamoeba invadens IP1 TaxID=370355 RepID=A0A0A1U5E9_ENTIV|nr:hypothetical protein EIN_318350 [Entamoeba invadens IP1]ELP86996.1 hypothetical protein EIN_318350 [Entamoeba invadens IP1]|eukprot:XP_004253767.1 hypothetical protein EIN_318350 [Entamoeba invadens IP1]
MAMTSLTPEEIRLLFIKKERDMLIYGFNYLDILSIYHPRYYNTGVLPKAIDLYFYPHPQMSGKVMSDNLILSSNQEDGTAQHLRQEKAEEKQETEIKEDSHLGTEKTVPLSDSSKSSISVPHQVETVKETPIQEAEDDDATITEDDADIRALRKKLAREQKMKEKMGKKPRNIKTRRNGKPKTIVDSDEITNVEAKKRVVSKVRTRASTKRKNSLDA